MKLLLILLRFFVTILLLTILVLIISPEEIAATILRSDWRWSLSALLLMPLFIAARIGKWFLLVRQVDSKAVLSKILPGYLWGMALGSITPGRLGELARVQNTKNPGACAGLFFLEKAIEVGCLFGFCLMAIVMFNFWVWWSSLLLILLLIICSVLWRKILIAFVCLSMATFGRPSRDRIENIKRTIMNIKISACVLLTFSCFCLFTIQIYLMLLGMGVKSDPMIFPLIPPLFLANVLPVTVGGYGIREVFAIYLFKIKHIDEVVAAFSVGIVTFFNLVIPAVFGAGVHISIKLFRIRKEYELN